MCMAVYMPCTKRMVASLCVVPYACHVAMEILQITDMMNQHMHSLQHSFRSSNVGLSLSEKQTRFFSGMDKLLQWVGNQQIRNMVVCCNFLIFVY
jgi:hypothetical protein